MDWFVVDITNYVVGKTYSSKHHPIGASSEELNTGVEIISRVLKEIVNMDLNDARIKDH